MNYFPEGHHIYIMILLDPQLDLVLMVNIHTDNSKYWQVFDGDCILFPKPWNTLCIMLISEVIFVN